MSHHVAVLGEELNLLQCNYGIRGDVDGFVDLAIGTSTTLFKQLVVVDGWL